MSTYNWHIVGIRPIDSFEGMTPLASYLFASTNSDSVADPRTASPFIRERMERLAWAGGALNALTRAASEVNWDGTFRVGPYVGVLPWPNEEARYLVAKQDNNGTCFIITKDFVMPLTPHQTVFYKAVVPEGEAAS